MIQYKYIKTIVVIINTNNLKIAGFYLLFFYAILQKNKAIKSPYYFI